MQIKLKTDTENFLHTNPALYLAFYRDPNLCTAHFIHALLAEYKAGKKVLDIGSGLGREVAYLNSMGYEATGLDNSQEMLSWAKEHYPASPFVYGDQADFSLNQQFDALFCVGSTFLYNFSNEAVLSSLQCFRKHLHNGGLLYLDMRNAAFFLTKEGQRWLTEDLAEQTIFEDTVVTLKTRFSIDLANQILQRDYSWTVTGWPPIIEHLRHRLFFPQELTNYLSSCSFRLLQIFDNPTPHAGKYDRQSPFVFSNEMLGTRMQVIAQAV
ncbi:MAG TPA: class I SAM-dependent methyltransferase [Methylomusa anaerophila]|uniref:Glycine/sarcosine N-methyltransferase n=2 Tax=Methylomusa anaerophila TaxID=1930071 RepID=A0A348AE76_9FIRM|nr:class I SAM-dependent methyltransferase [Methylomusa anaerophila]BBB89374.1 glycine/sarcosine N-methyltransferase [Methylomusa anaerophila]HML90450.1 class I SAM-dependent methyltransferase [Methylomusa anaerophila]